MKIVYLHLTDGERIAGTVSDDTADELRALQIVEDDETDDEAIEPDQIIVLSPCRVTMHDVMVPPKVTGGNAAITTLVNVQQEPVTSMRYWTSAIKGWQIADPDGSDPIAELVRRACPSLFPGAPENRNLTQEQERRRVRRGVIESA